MIFPEIYSDQTNRLIGVCAPSAGVGHKLESFDLSLETLRNNSFDIIETSSVRRDALPSADAAVRGSEFNELVKNESVFLILSASGGEYCYQMLEYINENAFKESPKWVCGASDPTAILYYITTCLDIASIYGVNAGSFDWRPLHAFQENALSVLAGNEITQNSFDKYDSCRDFSRDEVILDSEVCWNSNRPSVSASGRLIGGCLDVIDQILGTRYDGTEAFARRYADDGIIWYLDIFDMTPEHIIKTLDLIKEENGFDNAKAVIVGRIMFLGDTTEGEYEAMLFNYFGKLGIPCIFNADIGHVKPCMTLINGAYTELECSGGRGSIRQELR